MSREEKYEGLSNHFAHWEKIKDLVDQNIDLMINFSQSGQPRVGDDVARPVFAGKGIW